PAGMVLQSAVRFHSSTIRKKPFLWFASELASCCLLQEPANTSQPFQLTVRTNSFRKPKSSPKKLLAPLTFGKSALNPEFGPREIDKPALTQSSLVCTRRTAWLQLRLKRRRRTKRKFAIGRSRQRWRSRRKGISKKNEAATAPFFRGHQLAM